MHDWRETVRRKLERASLGPENESSVVEELAPHLEDLYAELRSSGVGEEEAQRLTLEELEDGEALARGVRPASPSPSVRLEARPLLGAIAMDVRTTWRALLRAPAFAASVVLHTRRGHRREHGDVFRGRVGASQTASLSQSRPPREGDCSHASGNHILRQPRLLRSWLLALRRE